VLESLDLSILYFCNRNLVNPVFDFLFVSFSNSSVFLWPLVVIISILLWKGGKKATMAVILVIICIAVVDPSTHYILKKLFSRLRPCHTFDDLRMIVSCGGLYGFPSNHAANSFAAATVLSLFYRRCTVFFTILAVMIGFSRIYLGKHYPTDVLAGAVWGILAAFLIIFIINKILWRTSAGKYLEKYRIEIQGALRWKTGQK